MALRAGAGKACINPTPDMFPLPLPKSSDWGLAPVTTDCVYDDMNCRAIAIESDKGRVMFVAWELSGVPNIENLREKISEAIGWKPEEIVTIGTHNHTGYFDANTFGRYEDTPEFRAWCEKAQAIELNAAVSAAKQALETMRDARIGFGESDSYVNTNRDLKTLGGYWVEARNLAGFSDKTLAIVKLVDTEGKLIAALMNYPCHATCCYLMQDADGIRKTSGNFNGIASRFVEDHFGNGAVAMWTSGAAGNQNPLLSHGLQYEYADGWTSAVDYPDGVGFMQMELMGRTHGADCVKGIDAINRYSDSAPVKHIYHNVMLPAQQKVTGGTSDGVAFRMGGRGVRDYEEVPFGNIPPVPEGFTMIDDPDHPVELRMQLIMLGEIAIVGMNAEIYCEIGKAIKDASPMKKTFVVTHTDNKRAGYILDKTAAERKEKVFQAFSAVKPGAADDLIVEGAVDMFDTAFSE